MKTFLKISFFVVFFLILFCCLCIEINRTGSDLFDGFVYFLKFLIFCFAIIAAVFGVKSYRKNSEILLVTPHLTAVILSILLFAIIIFHAYRANKSYFLFAGEAQGFNGMSLTLRNDSTYKIENFGGLGATDYYGNFQMVADTIYLKNIAVDCGLVSGRLIIKKDSLDEFSGCDTFIYETDKRGKIKIGCRFI